jgi:hypothetical protein
MNKLPENAKFIGDGVYIHFDGYYVWVLAYDGISITNKIALEDTVAVQLMNFIKECFGI